MFELKTMEVEDNHRTSVINYSDLEGKYTRIHDFKNLHLERKYLLIRQIATPPFMEIMLTLLCPF